MNENELEFQSKGFGAHDENSFGVKWEQTENSLIFQSQDATMIKILCSVSALANQSVQTAKQKETVKVIC